MTSIKISGALSNASKAINVIFSGKSDLNEFIENEGHTAQDDIRTFSNGNQTLRVLYGYPEPMFLVDDIIKIGIIKDPQMAIDRAQETNSAVFIMRKVNYEGFEHKPFLFTNFRGACAAAMSSFHDNPYQAAFSLSEILDFIQHHFLGLLKRNWEWGWAGAHPSAGGILPLPKDANKWLKPTRIERITLSSES